jgi:excisionase family DNA binding protein
MSEELLRTEQVAKLLNTSPATVRNWIRLGLIEAVRLPSGQYRVRREDLDKLLRREGQGPDLRD